MNGNLLLAIAIAGLGAIARTVIPYLEMLRDKPGTPFDRKFLVPVIISCAIAVLMLPLTFGSLPEALLDQMTLSIIGVLFVAGWGITDIVRAGQKTTER